MSKLESLVPPVELCKLIPAGEFEDSAHAWVLSNVVGFVCRTSGCEQVSGQQWQLIRSNASRIIRARKRGEQIYPAPTLEEIMAELPATTVCGKEHHSDWYVSHWRIGCVEDTERKGAATAALKLWLKLKGIEDGK